jgi:hypothetical protein
MTENSVERKNYQNLADESIVSDMSVSASRIINNALKEQKVVIPTNIEIKPNNDLLSIILKLLGENCLYMIASILYLGSLEGCKASQDDCVQFYSEKKVMLSYLILLVISSIMYLLQFTLYFRKKVRFYTLIFTCIFIAFLCFYLDTGTGLRYHGGYNRIVLLGLMLIYLLSYIIYRLVKYFYKLNKIFTLIVIPVFILFIFYRYYNFVQNSCYQWENGMGNSKIDNTSFCKITPPKICYERIFDNMFDMSGFFLENCNSIGNNKLSIINEYTNLNNETVRRVGYPRIEDWNFHQQSQYSNYKKAVISNLIDMDDEKIPKSLKDNIETYVDFNYSPPKVNISVKYNQTSELRAQVYEKNKTDLLIKNVFIFFIDSVSRNHLKRKLPKLYSWMQNFYNQSSENKKNIYSQSHEGFQFLKYHGVGTWTNVNMVPFYQGVPFSSNKRAEYILSKFKKAGYWTGSFSNQCSREIVDLHPGAFLGLGWTRYDHEFTSFFCDPNFAPPGEPFPLMNGPYGMRKKCLYNKPTVSYMLNYTEQFMNMYKDQAKFVRIGDINSHEGSGEVIKYDDEMLTQFIDRFFKNDWMNDTITIILSDHGYTMPGFHTLLKTEDHMKELLLPFMYIILPKNMNRFQEIRENLKANENAFITPYDIHETMMSFFTPFNETSTEGRPGQSIFFNRISRENPCQLFSIKEEWCKCSNSTDN